MTDPDPTDGQTAPEGIRLQKVLAGAGVASRRAAEELIADGRVDGSRIPPPRHHKYLVFNKPRGVVTTMDDPEGRRTVADYLDTKERLFHVGRLDAETQGLLIMTNDGEFAHRLSHPSQEIEKTYTAEVVGVMELTTVKQLRRGIVLDDGPIKPDQVSIVSTGAERTLVKVVLHSGANRVVRRMFEAVGHPVKKLSRTAIGPIRLGRLKSGESRELSRDELGALLDRVGL